MSQFIIALAAALAILTTVGTATTHATTMQAGSVAPSEVYLPDPV